MAVLVVADHDNKTLRDTTTKTVTAALQLSGEVDMLVLGTGCRAAAEAAAKVEGVRKVLLADREDLDKVIAETVADLILPLVMTGQHVTSDDIIDLGYGGLLEREMAFRFPDYNSDASDEEDSETSEEPESPE